MARPRLLLAVLATVAGSAGLPSAATAALPWAPCAPTGFQCAPLQVPVDRAGAVPGTITISIKRVPATANPGRIAVVALAGGPGQAAVPAGPSFARDLGPALATRDLVVFDQRGTGASSPLTCNAIRTATASTAADVDRVTRRCSEELGARRGFFRTADTVADLEALRVAGDYEKLALFGVSYGTKVATAYASAFPSRVESIVLDSVVPPEGPDAFRRSSLQAVPRVVDEICAGALCRNITSSASRDLATLATRLRRRSVGGVVVDASGRRRTQRIRESSLFGVLLAGDFNPTLRAELPGSLRAALAQDYKPILRLSQRSNGLENRLQSAAEDDSLALFLATTCEENTTFPWTRGAPVGTKTSEAQRGTDALPPGSTGPFSRRVALSLGVLPLCRGWLTASPTPVADGPIPAVPTLIIDGRADVRTPLEDAAALAARIPGAQLLPVPNVGHSVLGADPTDCSRNAVAAFYAAQPVAQCAPVPPRFAPTPRPPTRASRLTPYNRVPGKRGRTVEAFRRTVNDAQSQVLGAALALGRAPIGAGGLRSGSVRVLRGGLALRRLEYVPGILVTGTLLSRGTSRFRISGPQASAGVLEVSNTRAVAGTLDGRRVSTRFARAARLERPFGGLTLAQAVARGARQRAGR